MGAQDEWMFMMNVLSERMSADDRVSAWISAQHELSDQSKLSAEIEVALRKIR